MNTDYRYQLESKKLTGHQPRKLTCPHCGKQKCFVRYVDTKNGFRYVADTVGKCDHQHSCGYHYKLGDYYRDNQWAREPKAQPESHCTPAPLPPFQPLPMDYVQRSHSPRSTFWQWLSTELARRLGLGEEQLRHVYDDYLIGATRRGCVIFWQIDQRQQVHCAAQPAYLTLSTSLPDTLNKPSRPPQAAYLTRSSRLLDGVKQA